MWFGVGCSYQAERVWCRREFAILVLQKTVQIIDDTKEIQQSRRCNATLTSSPTTMCACPIPAYFFADKAPFNLLELSQAWKEEVEIPDIEK